MLDTTFLFQQHITALHDQGLNLSAVFELAHLPEPIVQLLEKNDIELDKFSRLVLLGNGGPVFWDSLERFGLDQPDPIDRFSLYLTQQLIDGLVSGQKPSADQNLILYPQTDFLVPLQQLGELAGWGTPSPIGNSISPEYGLWFAFRAAFLTRVELPPTPSKLRPSPCESCTDKPCQIACPAQAVFEAVTQFKLNSCIDYRLQRNSTCGLRCAARQACPVGIEHAYPEWSIKQLYGSSLTSIVAWRDNEHE